MCQGTTEQQEGKTKVLFRKSGPEAFIDFYCSCFASKFILRKNKSGLAPVLQTVVLKEQTTQEEDEKELKIKKNHQKPNTKVPRKLL